MTATPSSPTPTSPVDDGGSAKTAEHIEKMNDAIALLDEARGFAAMSPGGRENIAIVSDLLPEIAELAYRSGFVDGEKHASENTDMAARLAADPAMAILLEALRQIIRQDDTGPMVYEVRENGPSQAIGGSEGKFAAIARVAITNAAALLNARKSGGERV